jgi:hypothetical protein
LEGGVGPWFLFGPITATEACGEKEAGLLETIAAEEIGFCPIERGVGEREEAADRPCTTDAATGLGLMPLSLTIAPEVSPLSVGVFGSKFLMASADAGRRATSLSSAAITT